MSLVSQFIQAFIPLFVAIDPVGLAALLLLTAPAHAATVVHTSQADFSTGTYAGWGASVTVTGGGAVEPGIGGAELLPGFTTDNTTPHSAGAAGGRDGTGPDSPLQKGLE